MLKKEELDKVIDTNVKVSPIENKYPWISKNLITCDNKAHHKNVAVTFFQPQLVFKILPSNGNACLDRWVIAF